MSKSICLGVIGGGQLGSLLCSAAKKLKVKTVVLSDDKDGPAQYFCDEFIYSKYDDNAKVREFISKVDFVTYEFENIPVDFLNLIQKEKKVSPSPKINKIAQNRKLEKTFVNELGIKTTEWVFIKSAEDIKKNQHLLPGILKSNTLGYDGKGQYKINKFEDLNNNIDFNKKYILEKLVNLKKEISVVLTRFGHQKIEIYEPIENVHEDQILKHSKVPAEISDKISGRKLTISTNQPGIQLYTGNHLSEKFNQNQGLCLETQHFPDSPNNNKFPTTKLMAKEKYYSETTYLFGVI